MFLKHCIHHAPTNPFSRRKTPFYSHLLANLVSPLTPLCDFKVRRSGRPSTFLVLWRAKRSRFVSLWVFNERFSIWSTVDLGFSGLVIPEMIYKSGFVIIRTIPNLSRNREWCITLLGRWTEWSRFVICYIFSWICVTLLKQLYFIGQEQARANISVQPGHEQWIIDDNITAARVIMTELRHVSKGSWQPVIYIVR